MNGQPRRYHVLFVGNGLDSRDSPDEAIERESDRLTVEVATDSDEALERVDERPCDCLVSRYDLPTTDGVDLLETVRRDDDTLPFVLVTDDGSEPVASRAISAGVTDYVRHSESVDTYATLTDRIHEAVDRARSGTRAGEAERHLEAVTAASDDVHWLFSADWSETLFVDDAYESVWARSAETLRENPRDFLNGVHPDDRERVEAGMDALSAGDPVDSEIRVNADEQYRRRVRVRGEPVRDDTGAVVRVAGFVRDVTDRVERRQRLHRAEARFRTLAEHFPNGGVHYFDRDLRYQFVSGDGFQAVDIDPKDLQGNTIHEVEQYAEDVTETVESLMLATLDGAHETVELSYEDHIYEVHSVPLRDEGTVSGGFFITQDVTERRRRERELEARAAAMEASIDGMAILDGNEEYAFVNRAHANIYGYDDPEAFVGRSWRMCYGEPERERFESEVMPTLFAEGDWRGEATGLREDGSTFPQELSLTVTEDGRVICVVRDVSDRKEREERMARQNERLEEFAGVVSHDLRNPLQVVEGRLEQVRAGCDSDHLDAIEQGIGRMEALIDDLLTLAQQGDSVTGRDPVDIEAIAERSWRNVVTTDASLVVDTDRTVSGDAGQLKQLFENLMRNAVDHGGDDVTVTIGDVEGGFYLEDDGPGIPESERSAVFEAGYSTADDGTGFGLNIVRRVVDIHGWEIAVTDARDGGTRFEITDVRRGDP